MVKGGYDVGVAFDGDADRCLLVDEQGGEIDGDKVMAVCALDMKRRGKLDGNTIVLSGKTAKMADADCRDQVCVRTGTLTHAGQAAGCLPHRVVLKLVGVNDSGIDAVVS